MTVKQDLLAMLACPSCKSSVKEDGDSIVCRNAQCGLRYPVRDGIPVMLIDEAKKA